MTIRVCYCLINLWNSLVKHVLRLKLNGKTLNGKVLYAAKFLTWDQLVKKRTETFTNIYVRTELMNDEQQIRATFEVRISN